MLAASPSGYSVRRPLGPRLLGGAALLAIVAGVWWASTQQSTTTRQAAAASVLIPVTPPPPPPPPPEVKPPEPKPEEVPPQPVHQPTPSPQPPSPSPQAAASPGQAMSINGPAQAGGDAFNIGSGPGGGMNGSGRIGSGLGGFNRAAYAAYLEGEFRRAWESDKTLRGAALHAKVRVWIEPGGKIARVQVEGGSHADLVEAALVGRAVRPPDPSLAMPVNLALDLRRPG